MEDRYDIAIVGAGAAGLMAAVQAGRAAPDKRIVLLDGAKHLGAKILVAGGGRCNVTHFEVDERDFAGSTPPAIRKILRQFPVDETIAFFAELGVELKREETGKLFPVSDRAKTVLEALLGAVEAAGVELRHPFRVASITRTDEAFELHADEGVLTTRALVLATGGKSLPKSGSDGQGYALVTGLGHTLTERLEQALVPLRLPENHPLTKVPGLAADVHVEVRAATGKRLHAAEGALLCTHFGVSGPVVLDISRHWIHAGGELVVSWLPRLTEAQVNGALQNLRGANPSTWLGEHLPTRLAERLVLMAGLDPLRRHVELTRELRQALVTVLTALVLPVTEPRGWTWAEVTAGGVPLRETDLKSLASRVCPGLFLCGEILDVDGRIGGFNFQWAWASGTVVGRALGGSNR